LEVGRRGVGLGREVRRGTGPGASQKGKDPSGGQPGCRAGSRGARDPRSGGGARRVGQSGTWQGLGTTEASEDAEGAGPGSGRGLAVGGARSGLGSGDLGGRAFPAGPQRGCGEGGARRAGQWAGPDGWDSGRGPQGGAVGGAPRGSQDLDGRALLAGPQRERRGRGPARGGGRGQWAGPAGVGPRGPAVGVVPWGQ
jgi:hypothetical protein